MLLYMLLLTVQAPGVVVREPVPAHPWNEVFTARCGRDELDIARSIRPLGSVTIRLNGRSARGDIDPLLQELSEVGASYRFSVLCSQEGGTIYFKWVRGLADRQGRVRYRSGAASFRGGVIIKSGSEDSNAETFWYR